MAVFVTVLLASGAVLAAAVMTYKFQIT